jgi:glycosidase
MKKYYFSVLTLLLNCLPFFIIGQVVWTEPAFPTQFDDVIVYFDATKGNGALAGHTGDVYAHAGVITDQSSSGSDWKHVIGNWGTADSRVLMTRESENLYSISYNIETFYGIPPGEEVLQLAFVFRNVNGSIVGRDEDGSDIFVDIVPAQSGLFVNLQSPDDLQVISETDSLLISLNSSEKARFFIVDNGEVLFDDSTTSANFYLNPSLIGDHEITFDISNRSDTILITRRYYVVENEQAVLDAPDGMRDGVNYLGDTSFIFQIVAPGKTFIYFLCPENDYYLDPAFRMNKTSDGNRFWIELPKTIFENEKNAYTYFFEEGQVIADPYSELVLDPWNDPFLSAEIMEGLPPHPGPVYGPITVFDLEKTEYPWEVENFEKPRNTDLVIYELLIRDFLEDHNYASLIDTLDYLEKLGVNAIELMPIHEFEGNVGWGYNPAFHMAVDKYYGSREQLKQFIDEAHKRGIAVILDVVFNHAFGNSPLVRMYLDFVNFRPLPNNPWLNEIPKHPFNVGFDFNHESEFTKLWVKRNLEHWINNFHFDGFRFDLSKGMTQTNSGNDEGLMAQYDASRIAILKDYADYIWSQDSTSYVLLEHFAENSEETVLANYGMMIWGNSNHEFSEAAMGYSSDLDWIDYTVRGWNDPHIVGYMESHDEERLMYRILNFGDSEGDYNTRELSTALQRIEAVSAIFYSIPGPKMIWEFGELGYDFSINRCTNGTINNDCRLSPKPIRWDYLDDWRRERLFNVTSSMMHLKKNYPTFSTTDFNFNDGNFFLKTVHLNHPDMDAVTLANFRVRNSDLNPKFQYPGTWYEYFTGDSIIVDDTQEKITFQPGEYRLYTSKRITTPNGFTTSIKDIDVVSSVEIVPNPVSAGNWVRIQLPSNDPVEFVELVSASGRTRSVSYEYNFGDLRLATPRDLKPGVYTIRILTAKEVFLGKVLISY